LNDFLPKLQNKEIYYVAETKSKKRTERFYPH